jgi:hypothetical protein
VLKGGGTGGESKGALLPAEGRLRIGLRESRLIGPNTDSLSSAAAAAPVRSWTPFGTTRLPCSDA